jgi:hypothetical protein
MTLPSTSFVRASCCTILLLGVEGVDLRFDGTGARLSDKEAMRVSFKKAESFAGEISAKSRPIGANLQI